MRSWIFTKIILLLIDVVVSEVSSCPSSEKVYPCYCISDFFPAIIGCESVSIDRIYPILKNTKGMNISYSFWKSRLGDIPADFFDGQQAISLNFENCKIRSFGDRPFTGLEDTLKRLSIYGSIDKTTKDLETFPLGHLKKLEDLAFQANDIKRLGNDWFETGPSSLTELNLEANDIEELGDRAFASLLNIQQIWLGDNSFKRVSRSMFPRPAKKLELLEISFSGIEELPHDIFEDMPALKNVIASGNKLKSLPEATWGKIWNQLDEVYLDRNNGFQCDENIRWIYQRKLPQKIFGECTDRKHYGKKLKDLTLSDFE